MVKYRFEKTMREISGFGGDYEAECRKMLRRGLLWLDEHPGADIRYNNGSVFSPSNQETADLEEVVTGNSLPSGAMLGTVLVHLYWIHTHSWKEYMEKMIEEKTKEDENGN